MKWTRASKDLRVATGALLGVIVVLALIVNTVPMVEKMLTGSGISVCMMKNSTGIPCMGCRGTRAALAFAHGDLPASFAFNPLLAGIAVSLTGWAGLVSITGRQIDFSIRGPARSLMYITVGFLILGNWIYVIAAGG